MIQLENPTYIIAGGSYRGDSSWNAVSNQSDQCYKLYHVVEGELWIDGVTGERHILHESQLYLINGHNIRRYGTESQFTTNWIHFKAQNIVLDSTMRDLPTVVQLPRSIVTLIEEIGAESLYNLEIVAESLIARLRLQSILQTIIVRAIQIAGVEPRSESDELRRIEPAIEYIRSNIGRNILLEELASCCCLSVSHFCKLFKFATRSTPNSFILTERMSGASRMIRAGVDIKEIAAEMGFYDSAHFCRAFKRFFGVTPSLYRDHQSC